MTFVLYECSAPQLKVNSVSIAENYKIFEIENTRVCLRQKQLTVIKGTLTNANVICVNKTARTILFSYADADVGVSSEYGIVSICEGELIVEILQHVRMLPTVFLNA